MRVRVSLVVFAGMWMLSSCAGMDSGSMDAATQVRERAEQRWQYLLKGQLDEAYAYLSPGSRERVTVAYYKGSLKPGMWRDAKVTGVDCAADVCKVQVDVSYLYMRPNVKYESVRTLDESWVNDGGQWWYLLPP
jgi:hypothetical protein